VGGRSKGSYNPKGLGKGPLRRLVETKAKGRESQKRKGRRGKRLKKTRATNGINLG